MTSLDSLTEKPSSWWGKYTFDSSPVLQWRLGAMQLMAIHSEHEWQIKYKQLNDEHAEKDEVEYRVDPDLPWDDNDAEQKRYHFLNAPNTLIVEPSLADRPVVAKPLTPFHIPPGGKATLYIGSPVWVQISTLRPTCLLLDIPIHRPSDTWLGPNTWSGELCYAAKTSARTVLSDIPVRPYRAFTAVNIANKSTELQLIERVKLPTPFLRIYCADNAILWTDDINIVIEEKLNAARFEIKKGMPKQASNGQKIAHARKKPERYNFERAFEAIFG